MDVLRLVQVHKQHMITLHRLGLASRCLRSAAELVFALICLTHAKQAKWRTIIKTCATSSCTPLHPGVTQALTGSNNRGNKL
jgi:hypothetical protein